jgi:isopenicillin N synthase-like dioxygenase
MKLSFLQRLVVVAQVQAAVNAISSRHHLVDAESTHHVKSTELDSAIIPIISLGPWMEPAQDDAARRYVVRQIQDACSSVGFFLIEDHGINSTILSDAWEVTEAFFDMPLHQKQRYITPNMAEYPYGYEQSERLAKGKALDHDDSDANLEMGSPDLKETFSIGPDDLASGMPLRRWVDDNNDEMNFVKKFRNVIEDYYSQLDRLSRLLLRLFALALDQPETFFNDKMDHHMGALRLVHYYPLVPPRNQPDVIRAGAHSDYGPLTILNARDPGLEVYLMDENNSERQWLGVPLVPGALVINLGDLMQRWTNGKRDAVADR